MLNGSLPNLLPPHRPHSLPLPLLRVPIPSTVPPAVTQLKEVKQQRGRQAQQGFIYLAKPWLFFFFSSSCPQLLTEEFTSFPHLSWKIQPQIPPGTKVWVLGWVVWVSGWLAVFWKGKKQRRGCWFGFLLLDCVFALFGLSPPAPQYKNTKLFSLLDIFQLRYEQIVFPCNFTTKLQNLSKQRYLMEILTHA